MTELTLGRCIVSCTERSAPPSSGLDSKGLWLLGLLEVGRSSSADACSFPGRRTANVLSSLSLKPG